MCLHADKYYNMDTQSSCTQKCESSVSARLPCSVLCLSDAYSPKTAAFCAGRRQNGPTASFIS